MQSGHLIVIQFPGREQAEAWYASDPYQAILPLRTNSADGSAIIVDGVKHGHGASDLVPATG